MGLKVHMLAATILLILSTSAAQISDAMDALAAREAEPETRTVTMTFAGDCCLATYLGGSASGSFNAKAKEGDWTYFLDGVADHFRTDDFSVVNLENVLTDRALEPVEKDHDPAYWFRGPTANINALTCSEVEVVSLSNNHTGDYGKAGLQDTIAAVEAAGLQWGDGTKTLYLEKDGFTIALICNGLWYEGQANSIIKRIHEAEENSDFQIVFFHGGTERLHAPEDWKVRACRRLVDAGADLVVGNHPHVLQPLEVYNDVPIIYSMGNFCYGGGKSENRTILYRLYITVEEDNSFSIQDEIIPCYVYTGSRNDFRPTPILDEAERQRVLDFMAGLTDSPL